MNSLFTLALVSLSLVGCGKQVLITHKPDTSGKRSYTVANELKNVAESYFKACDKAGVQCSVYHLSVSVGDPGINRAGVCVIEWDKTGRMHQRITIRPDYINNYAVIWHELEHCTRFQEHTDGDAPHIMRTYAMNDAELAERPMEEWLKESLERNVRFSGYENK